MVYTNIVIVYGCLYVSPRHKRSYNILRIVYIAKHLWGRRKVEKRYQLTRIPCVSYGKC
jgi:hypothetical protein